MRRLYGNLAAAADRAPVDFEDLLLTPGAGGRTVQALAMVAEVVHGAPYRFSAPARFSLAHGGKDRHPFPVPLKVYDETIRVMKSAVQKGRLGREEELLARKRLDDQSLQLERYVTGPDLKETIAPTVYLSFPPHDNCAGFPMATPAAALKRPAFGDHWPPHTNFWG